MPAQTEDFPIVMRMQGMWPHQLGGYETHRTRKGGDLAHVDKARSPLNRSLIGSSDWAQAAWEEISEMTAENFSLELENLKKRRRKAEIKRRLQEGPRDPWRSSKDGPLREVILTVNKRWFELDIGDFLGEAGPSLEDQFEKRAVEWLTETFGDDCIHARADLDEVAYHIHAVILPRAVTQDGRRMVQPSVHPVIRNYEDGQDSVGEWFESLGLRRGEKRKQALRDALEHNRKAREAHESGQPQSLDLVDIPEHRAHVSPRKWREAQERRLCEREHAVATREREIGIREIALEGREADVDARQSEADAALEVARRVADGQLDLSAPSPSARTVTTENVPPSAAHRLFGRALDVLRAQARREARAELSDAFAEIEAADAVIVDIAKGLGDAARRRIGQARKALTKSIIGLSRTIKQLPDWGRDDGSIE